MQGNVLVIGEAPHLRHALEQVLPGIVVREADTACEAEGREVDVVVIATSFPLEELAQVRVHPRLGDTPVVLIASGQVLPPRDWSDLNAWPTTVDGPDELEELTGLVAHLIALARRSSSSPSRPHTRLSRTT